jgi:hypothetical protein
LPRSTTNDPSPTRRPTIELRFLGYEFPDGADDWHDLNWLRILVRVESGSASWTGGPDPCLLTSEAKVLAEWLRSAADGWLPPPEFLEPTLSFAVVRSPDARGIPLAVTFRHALVTGQTLVLFASCLLCYTSHLRRCEQPPSPTLKQICYGSQFGALVLEMGGILACADERCVAADDARLEWSVAAERSVRPTR